ncbi:MAG TPA: urea amidolyase associated protein UAAP1 [Acidimicrobiales bacterium]|nr:urea amidolyase associated protein UAAP1 [Acidimicrobiales bacterium]
MPPSAAISLPSGVDSQMVFWDETVDVGGYSGLRVPRGSYLRIADLAGDACVSLVVYNAWQPSERLNVADTVKVQWQAYLGEGALLLSDMGRALMTIVEDSSGRHDALCGATTRVANERRYGHGAVHGPSPATRELLTLAAAKHGLDRRDLPPCINLFKSVRVRDDGSLVFDGASTGATFVQLRADLDVIVLMASAPHPLDARPGYAGSITRLTAWGSQPRDPMMDATTPERRRAYENTAQYVEIWSR